MEIKVVCRMDYECRTLISWLVEISDVLSGDVGEEVLVYEVFSEELEEPAVYVDSELALVGVPGEEGYLIEVLKHAIEDVKSKKR